MLGFSRPLNALLFKNTHVYSLEAKFSGLWLFSKIPKTYNFSSEILKEFPTRPFVSQGKEKQLLTEHTEYRAEIERKRIRPDLVNLCNGEVGECKNLSVL